MNVDVFEGILVVAMFLGVIVQGFSGFAFSAAAGAILLQMQAPDLAIPLLMICSLLIQVFVLVRLRSALSLRASRPCRAGAAAGRVTDMHFVATIALVALLALPASPSRAQALDKPDPSVRTWLPACQSFLEHADTTGSEGAGLCAGAVDALLYIGEVLMPDYSFCVPLQTTRREVIAGIVEDIKALRPEADRQNFQGMVLEILRYRWPCRD